MKKLLFFSLAFAAVTMFGIKANADMIIEYDSGVAATAGTSGANDPTTVAGGSWTINSGTNGGFRSAGDSGNGGWRITDGSGIGFVPAYSHAFSSAEETALTAGGGWVLTFTMSMPRDAIGAVDDAFSNNYYSTESRQNNNLMLIEDGANSYSVGFTGVDPNTMVVNGVTLAGPVLFNDETSVTGGPDGASTDTVNFVSFTLSHPGTGTSALLTASTGDSFAVAGTADTSGRIYWGSGSAAGQGSTVWNSIELNTVPEPTSFALFCVGLVGLAARRRRG